MWFLGIQGGTDVVEQKLEKVLAKRYEGIWSMVPRLAGQTYYFFGKRLMWNWKWNESEYPELDKNWQSGKKMIFVF